MAAQEKRDQKGAWKRVATSLYRYKNNGVYYAYVKRSGKLIRRSLETSDREHANRKLRDFLRDLDSNQLDAHKTRFCDYIDDFLAGRTGAPKTLKRYRKIAEEIKASWPGGANQLLRNVDLSQCTKWLSQWNGKVATYNHSRQWLMAFFDYAVANGKIQKSPIDTKNLKAMRRPKPIRNAPTPEQFEAIVNEIRSQIFTDHSDDSADVVEFMGRAGVGQAEIDGLRWQDIDFDNKTITLFRVKTKSSFRVPIYPRLEPLLERLRKESPDVSPADPVFRVGSPKKSLAAACNRLNFPNFSPRSFRRMFIIEALNKGVPVKTISKWQGHQDGGVLILRTYSEVIDQQHHHEAAQLLG